MLRAIGWSSSLLFVGCLILPAAAHDRSSAQPFRYDSRFDSGQLEDFEEDLFDQDNFDLKHSFDSRRTPPRMHCDSQRCMPMPNYRMESRRSWFEPEPRWREWEYERRDRCSPIRSRSEDYRSYPSYRWSAPFGHNRMPW